MYEWIKLETEEYINLEETLFSGQVFIFKRVDIDEYAGVIQDTPIILKQINKNIFYRNTVDSIEKILRDFFNLNVVVHVEMPRMGLRFLTNDVIPTIFSFICSSNNNINRISKMVEFLYSKGEIIKLEETIKCIDKKCDFDISENYKNDFSSHKYKGYVFYKFPELEKLLEIEKELIENKFGYRAKYICDAARYLMDNPFDFNSSNYESARTYLLGIKGVGFKVSDCICLISLRMFHIVPIDTHVFRYSKERFSLNIKNLNEFNYKLIQSKWNEIYKDQAGIFQLHIFKTSVNNKVTKRKLKAT